MMPRHWLAPFFLGLIGTASAASLELETEILLGDVHGRIDHLAVDVERQRLFVAELGNDSVGVVDLKARRTIHTVGGLHQPQGVGYVPSTDSIYVANANDGSVSIFQGADLTPTGQIPLGDDADNVRVDETAGRVMIGYGGGAIAIIDAKTQRKTADIALKAHPESLQIWPSADRIFVNVPDAHEVAAVDIVAGKQVASWSTNDCRANFPLAVDEANRTVLVVYRRPAMLGAFAAQDGRPTAAINTCGDADDVFVDPKRNLVYVICGEGFLDVLRMQGETYASLERIPTSPGARTGLFIPQIDRLVVAVRATAKNRAAIWVFRPTM